MVSEFVCLPESSVASKTTLNAKNLEALGAERLAELLIEVSTGNAAAKGRLRLELAGATSPREIAKEVRKRLATIARSRSFLDWRGCRMLVDDLESQRRAIADGVAKLDPAEALELTWRFMALAASVYGRCDDSNGVIAGIFHAACSDLGVVAQTAKPDPVRLADQAYQALLENDYGHFDELVAVLAPALGHEGLEHLKRRMIALSATPVQPPAGKERQVIGWGSGRGPIYADELAEQSRVSAVRLALKEIADAQGDVDAYIGQYDERTRKVPKIAAEIARRLLAVGRPEEALKTIEATEHRRIGSWDWPDFEWEDAWIDVLEALGRKDEAQAVRWGCFERSLSASHLRAYLKRLGDFDDVEAAEKALDYAQGSPNLIQALHFLVSWPALDRAASLVMRRTGELDGDQYEVLPRAADALAAKHPLAATLVLRSLIDFSLSNSRSSRYKHAARHLLECSSLSSVIGDFGASETHDDYAARLRREHGKKTSFWSLLHDA